MNPKISVITVTYNTEDMIRATIDSVINQTYEMIEYIIIDGFSTDQTVQIIQSYRDMLSYFVSEKDGGIYDAMNKGLRVATGDWIIFLNAGDIFYSHDIIESISHSMDKNIDLIYGPIVLNHYNGYVVKPKKFILFNLLFWGTGTLCHQSMFVRRSIAVQYSSHFRLKGELNWYFELLNRIRNYKRVTFPIVVYSTQGAGTQNYILNHKESIKVVYAQKGWLSIIALPFVFYSFIKSWIYSRRS